MILLDAEFRPPPLSNVLFGRKLYRTEFLTVFNKIRRNFEHLRAILVEVYEIRTARVRSATWIRHESEYSQIQPRNVHGNT